MDTPTIISVSNLTKYYGSTLGVQNINFTVNQGEIFGFLGPNGAGKTTTIRMLLDLLRPSSGEINIFDHEIYNHSLEIRKRCGYLPGNFFAYGNMTGAGFLRFVASMRKAEPGLQESLIDRFQLSQDDLSQKIKHLSHGTLQKLGIIQAFFLFLIIFCALCSSLLSINIFHQLTNEFFVKMVKIGCNLWLLFVFIMSLTMVLSSFEKEGNKVGIRVAGIALVFYLLHYLSSLWNAIQFTKPFNIFTYYQPEDLMTGQRSFLLHFMVLSSLILLCLFVSIYQFNRRDIPG